MKDWEIRHVVSCLGAEKPSRTDVFAKLSRKYALPAEEMAVARREELVTLAVAEQPRAKHFRWCSKSSQTPAAAMAAAPWQLSHVRKDLRNRLVILAAVRRNGLALRLAGELRGDREVVLEAMRQCLRSLRFATLCGDYNFMKEALEQAPLALRYASAPLRARRELVVPALRRRGICLRYASPELSDDWDLALLAVATAKKRAAPVLRAASARLQQSKAFVLEAVRLGQCFSSCAFQADLEVLVRAVASGDDEALQHSPLRDDLDAVLQVVRLDGESLRHASAHVRAEPQVVREAFLSHGPAYRHGLVQGDKGLALEVVKVWSGALAYMSAELRRDDEVLETALLHQGLVQTCKFFA